MAKTAIQLQIELHNAIRNNLPNVGDLQRQFGEAQSREKAAKVAGVTSPKVQRKEKEMGSAYIAAADPKKDYEKYVTQDRGLAKAYEAIQAGNTKESRYWLNRMGGGTDIASFGKAHAAEARAIKSGQYLGHTSVTPDQIRLRNLPDIGKSEIRTDCFIDGVKIETADGSEKNISDIQIGEYVKTKDGKGVVEKVFHATAGPQKLYGFNGKEPFATGAHPFMTQNGWKQISDLEIGDVLYRNGRGSVLIQSIRSVEIPSDTPVYNFHVNGEENYYADGYLVHNKTYPVKNIPPVRTGSDPNGSIYIPEGIQPMQLAELTDDMMLSDRLREIINKNSPLFKAARQRALSEMNKRGIVNSSIAEEAVMNALLAVAMPIAQAEVNALQTELYYNTDWTNKERTDRNNYYYQSMIAKMGKEMDYQLQYMVQSFGAWGRYGDWISRLGTTPGMDAGAVDWTMGALPQLPPWFYNQQR